MIQQSTPLAPRSCRARAPARTSLHRQSMSRRVVLLLLLLVALVAALVRSAEAVCLFGLNLSLLLCTCDYADVTCDGPLSGLLVGEIPVGATSFTQINNPGITALASRLLSLAVPTLITLDLTNNAIASIDVNAFASLPNLQNLILVSNQITTLAPAVFANIPATVTTLNLASNSLNCCELDYIRSHPRKSILQNAVCAYPSSVAGQSLLTLPFAPSECGFPTTTPVSTTPISTTPVASTTPISTTPVASSTTAAAPASCTGNVVISNPVELALFLVGCSAYAGSIHLAPLPGAGFLNDQIALPSSLTSIAGDLIVSNTADITSFKLNQLTNIVGRLEIANNLALSSIIGIPTLTTVNGDILIQNNTQLCISDEQITALHHLSMSSVQVQPSSASCLNNLLASITQAVNSADVAGAQSAIESLAAVALQVSDSSALAVVGALDAALTLSSNTTSPGSAQIAAPALAAIGTMLSTADETWSVDALMTSIPSDALASQHPAELTRRAAQSLARGAAASAPLSCDSERVSTGSSNMETASLRASGSSAAGLQWHSADQSARFSLPSTLSNLASAAVSSECESSLSIGFIFYSKPSFFENDAQTLSFASTAGLARVANVVASALAVETTPSSSIVGASPTSTAAPAAGELVFSRFLLSSVIAADVVESSTDATPAGLYRFSLQILPNATHVLTTARILLAANSTTPHTVNPSATADWTTLAAAVECGFWNFSLHSEASPSGMWDTTGCQRVAVHSNGTVDCQCAHLTNFAVLFVTDRAAGTALASSVEGEALEYLTYIGCAVTIVGCLITIVTFLVFRSLRKVPIKLLLILCGSIVLVQLFFILSTSLAGTASNAGCIALGVLFHYVLLLQFFSSFVHGLHLFRSIATTELSTSLDRSFRQYVRVIVLAPALLMCVYIAIFAAATGGDLDGVYGDMFDDGRICFIPSAVGAICSLAVPVLLIIAVNFVIFFKIARIMVHANKLFDGAYAHNAKVFAGMTALLGLSWGLGLLVMVSDSQSVFVWLFVICNGLQGVILAFVYCTSDQVKGAYRELLSTLNSTRSTHVGTLESPAGSNNHSGLGGGAAPLLAHQALARQPTNVRVIRVERLSNQVLLRKQPSGDLTHAAPQTPQTPQGANLRNAAEYSELRARSKSTPVLYDALDQAQIAALAGPSSLQQQDNDHIYHRPADQLEVPKTQLGRCKSEDLKTNQSHRRSNSELFHKKSRSPRASSPRPASPGSQGTSVMHSIRSLLTPSSANSTATLNLEHQMMVNLGVYDDVRASVVEPDLDLEDILIIDDSADSTHSDPKKRYRFVSKRPDSHAGLQRPLFAPPSPGDSAASSRHTSSTFASNHDLSDQKAAEALGNHVSPAAAQGYDFPLARLRYDDTPQSYYEAMRFESEAV